MVVAEVIQTLSVSKRAEENCDIQRFNINKLNYIEIKQEYQFKISNVISCEKLG
jgi:hypothetical protein